MTKGTLISVFGVWVLCQLFAGELLPRLGIAGTPDAGTLTLTQAQLQEPSEDSRDRRAAAPHPPAPTHGPQ